MMMHGIMIGGLIICGLFCALLIYFYCAEQRRIEAELAEYRRHGHFKGHLYMGKEKDEKVEDPATSTSTSAAVTVNVDAPPVKDPPSSEATRPIDSVDSGGGGDLQQHDPEPEASSQSQRPQASSPIPIPAPNPKPRPVPNPRTRRKDTSSNGNNEGDTDNHEGGPADPPQPGWHFVVENVDEIRPVPIPKPRTKKLTTQVIVNHVNGREPQHESL